MARQIIEANPTERFKLDKSIPQLKVAEFFTETVQGEGVSTGVPAAFLRLKDCTLNCVWCDSTEVWRFGNPYTIEQMLDIIENDPHLLNFLYKGAHLVITGGSPLKQQDMIVSFMMSFRARFKFKPFIEIENEAVLVPTEGMIHIVDQWNNSPKLSNAQQKRNIYYKPEAIKAAAQQENSWFKFVVEKEEDWNEIVEDFLKPKLIDRDQIILMPCGSNQQELAQTREMAASIAIRENVRFSDRLHVTLWDQKTGV